MAAIGTVMSDSARSDIVTLINEYDGDPYYAGDDGGWKSGKKRLLEAVDKACDIAGAASASSLGSEFHKLAEIVNHGKIPRIVQPRLVAPLAHYRERVAGIKFLHQEILIINDEIQRAGSIDYLMELPKGTIGPDGEPIADPWVVSGDLKTGKWDVDYCAGVSAQLAGYGLGFRYNQETNERLPLHPDANREWAVMVHFPLSKSDARVGFHWISLEQGLRAAKANNFLDGVIKFFKSKDGKPIPFELGAA